MATRKQIEANRRNAQRSTGPATPAGKAAVRFNALKSGIDAASLIIPGEDPGKLSTLADEFSDTWKPADPHERELVDQLIDDAWRLRRLRFAETQIWTLSIEHRRTCRDHRDHTEFGDAYAGRSETLGRLQRLITSIKRSFHQTTADLERLQAARIKAAEAAQFEAEAEPEPAEPLTESPANNIVVEEQSRFGVTFRTDDPDTPIVVPPQAQRGQAFWKNLGS